MSYSRDWGKVQSRTIRHKLGVDTLEEALAMTETERESVSRADFDKLTRLVEGLGDALDKLGRAGTGGEREHAAAVVKERELDVKDHARALGLSLEDVQKLKEEKDYERFKGFFDRRDAELAAEEEEAAKNGKGEKEGKTVGEKLVDGLGGIRNRPKAEKQ